MKTKVSKSAQIVWAVLQQKQKQKEQARTIWQERYIFEQCKQARPQRRKYHNTLFREQMGTIGETIVTRHTASGRAIVCRTKNIY